MNNKKTKKCVLIGNYLRGGLGFPGLKIRSTLSTPLALSKHDPCTGASPPGIVI